jgi:catechol 2,3-dioxygenase-like lactoylglutathione lyase family enzyme
MIRKVTLVTIHCTDQQSARDFYVDTLGMEVRADATSEGVRWLLVGPPAQPELSLMLMEPGPPLGEESITMLRKLVERGELSPITLAVDDCRATVRVLKAKGVEMVHEPVDQPFGVEALIRDDSGNSLVLLEYRT